MVKLDELTMIDAPVARCFDLARSVEVHLARQALRPFYFQDTMTQGVFRFMRHDHFFRPLPGGTTEMRDTFCFAAPLTVLGWLTEAAVLRRAVIKTIAESSAWSPCLPARPEGP